MTAPALDERALAIAVQAAVYSIVEDAADHVTDPKQDRHVRAAITVYLAALAPAAPVEQQEARLVATFRGQIPAQIFTAPPAQPDRLAALEAVAHKVVEHTGHGKVRCRICGWNSPENKEQHDPDCPMGALASTGGETR